jgi:transposase
MEKKRKKEKPYRPPRQFPAEFRTRMVELVRAGRSPASLGREFEVAPQIIGRWVQQADRDEGRRSDGITTDERTELQRLRRENARLREERDILKKAAAWFAQETGTITPRSSDS